VLRARYVNWVHLRERRTGRSLFVLNTHAVPTVQAGSGGPNDRLPQRLSIYRKHMRGLQQMVTRFKKKGGKVFVTGDLNVNYRTDCRVAAHLFPYHRLGDVGMRASYRALGMPERGTHVLPSGGDRRLIDYVYYLPRRSVHPEEQHILHGYSSDHRPLLVGFALTARR
jgi:endonuclease/exonuclease/phosphatase (EEP) superfamily protein YafD